LVTLCVWDLMKNKRARLVLPGYYKPILSLYIASRVCDTDLAGARFRPKGGSSGVVVFLRVTSGETLVDLVGIMVFSQLVPTF
jgi:hypothetical protein